MPALPGIRRLAAPAGYICQMGETGGWKWENPHGNGLIPALDVRNIGSIPNHCARQRPMCDQVPQKPKPPEAHHPHKPEHAPKQEDLNLCDIYGNERTVINTVNGSNNRIVNNVDNSINIQDNRQINVNIIHVSGCCCGCGSRPCVPEVPMYCEPI